MNRSIAISACSLIGITTIWSGCSGTPVVEPGQGGSTWGGFSSTGGSGGLGSSTGGSSASTGGASTSTGGASPSTGGASPSTGGASAQGCPDSSAYVGNSAWPQRLQVNAGADYCGGWRGSRTLEQELAAKAKLHIAAGAYPLPDTAGTYSFALPVCFEFPNGMSAPVFAGAGPLVLSKSTRAPDVSFTDDFTQPLAASGSSTWSFLGYLSLASTVGVQPAPLVLDGTGLLASNNTFQVLGLCASANCAAVSDIGFESCNPTTYALNRTTVTFNGGQVVFEVRIATLPGGISESPMFVKASGTFDSVTFEQRDYWKLVYAATHHQFSRSFAVLFDSPINGACGLKVLTLDPYNGSQMPEVDVVHCDLSSIAARSVSAAVTERL